MDRAEYRVVLDLPLTDEQRTGIAAAIQEAVTAKVAGLDFKYDLKPIDAADQLSLRATGKWPWPIILGLWIEQL